MPNYRDIDPKDPAGKRTLEKLIALRTKLNAEIPRKDLEDNLLLATWNIREFDSPSFGERLPESFYYIAEVMSRFDLIAIQEVRKNLKAMDHLLSIMGPTWKYILNDVTEGRQGNNERTAFLYDTRKVNFASLAGELVLPPTKVKKGRKFIYEPITQVARTPFMVGFTAGWTTFLISTVHILFGKQTANDPKRVAEIKHIAKFLGDRSKDASAWSKNLILLGDFNIFHPKDLTMKAITDEGFVIPPELQKLPSNAQKSKYYDQIAFKVRKDRFSTTGKAGVVDVFETVFSDADESLYEAEMGDAYHKTTRGKARSARAKSTYYKTYWRTHQMSDHLPMWVEFKINFSDQYLDNKLASASGADFEDVESQGDWSREFDFTNMESSAPAGPPPDKSGEDLTGEDFSEQNLSGGVFYETNLTGAFFINTTLQNADMRYAVLTGANLSGADLKDANLQGANLFEANLEGADLQRADLSKATLFGAILDGVKIKGATFSEKQEALLKKAGLDLGGVEFV